MNIYENLDFKPKIRDYNVFSVCTIAKSRGPFFYLAQSAIWCPLATCDVEAVLKFKVGFLELDTPN